MSLSIDVLSAGSKTILERVGVRLSNPTPEEARTGNAAMAAWVSLPAPSVALIEDFDVPGAETTEAQLYPAIKVRRFVPKNSSSTLPTQALVFFHGGGWVVGTLDVYAALCARLANRLQVQVFCVDYRLSPEVRYPVPNQDCARAYRYLCNEASRFGLDVTALMVGGDSAGAHLAITLCRWLKRDPLANQPSAQILMYPVADRALNSASCRQFEQGYYLSRAAMEWYWTQYLTVDEHQPAPDASDVSPLHAADLNGLPRAIIVTAGCDILRDEGKALADALQGADVSVSYRCVPGMLHGFMRFDAYCPESQLTVDWIAAQI
jgi:acetyl esterase